MAYQFDLHRLFHDLGGPAQVARRLGEMDLPVQPRTPFAWVRRGNVDAIYLANLLAHAALVERRPIELSHYLMPVSATALPAPRRAQRAIRPVREP